jgi:galactokinase
VAEGEAAGWAPGRVNLIGEHTDYNGGFVLPVALTLGVGAEVAPAPSSVVISDAADERTSQLALAVCRALGVPDAFRARVTSDLPAGAGLGSSAAFEVALARGLRELHGLSLEDRDLALACHRAENELVRCGVMDQLAAALGEPGTALLIDCTSLELTRIDLPRELELAVLDSGVTRANADSGYQERRRECEEAARLLGARVLREVHEGATAGAGPTAGAHPVSDAIVALPDPLAHRVRHVLDEDARVLAAADALRRGDAVALAELMRASHVSQRDRFEVSLPEVDALVERAEAAGALAARLTGGGFGGAVVALCERGRAATVAAATGAPLVAVAQPK